MHKHHRASVAGYCVLLVITLSMIFAPSVSANSKKPDPINVEVETGGDTFKRSASSAASIMLTNCMEGGSIQAVPFGISEGGPSPACMWLMGHSHAIEMCDKFPTKQVFDGKCAEAGAVCIEASQYCEDAEWLWQEFISQMKHDKPFFLWRGLGKLSPKIIRDRLE